MIYDIVSVAYSIANITLAIVIFSKSRRSFLARFYGLCVGWLGLLNVIAFYLNSTPDSTMFAILEPAAVFLYSLFPGLFIHFVIIFVRRYEILRSRYVVPAIYLMGILSYTVILLGLIPKPVFVTQGGQFNTYQVFYLTWASIFFTVGIAVLYELARGFYEKIGRANVLLVSFIVLLLVLPGPFTETVFLKLFGANVTWYYISCTLALVAAVYFIFRHKIIISSFYDALKTALSNMNDIFIITDAQLNIEGIRGRAVTTLLGYDPTELERKSLSVIFATKQDILRYQPDVLRGDLKEAYFDAEILGKNGQSLLMNFSLAPMILNDGEVSGFVCVGRDMTERRRMEEDLRQAQKMESLGKLAGGIAHDFNNVLQIMVINNAVLERPPFVEAQVLRAGKTFQEAIERANGLVKQILTFARKVQVQYEALDLGVLIQGALDMIQLTFPKTVTFSLSLSAAVPEVVADRNQLHQVLMNLCVNARDAMPEGGKITISSAVVSGSSLTKTFSEAVVDRSYVSVSVSDTGMGMDESTRNRIFEPFFTTKATGKGTGLGLAVVYGIVKAHNGFIDVQSKSGSGTTFLVYLPLAEGARKKEENDSGAPQVVQRGTETILIVEDEELILRSLETLLENRGFKVLTASGGFEALEVYRSHQRIIALVITDLDMPDLNGWDLFLKMKEINPKVQAIIASGYIDPKMKQSKFEGGIKDIIQKPYKPDTIFQSIHRILEEQAAGHAR